MDFRSRRRDLLALLISMSASTCSAPQDDHPDVPPDPPNVEMASPANTAVEMAGSPSVEAQTQCEWESGFRISPDSIGPMATTDPVGVVKELCPQAQYKPAENFPLRRGAVPAIVIPIPGGELTGVQPRRSLVEGLDVEQPVSVWHVTGGGTLPEGMSMKSTLGDLRGAYGRGSVSADIIDGRISSISAFFNQVPGIAFLIENLDLSALVGVNVRGFGVLNSSVPDSATIRGVSVRGVTIRGVGRSFHTPSCTSLYDLDSFEDHLRCAELGDAIAQMNVAYRYRAGEGIPEDDAEAVRWYRLAAEQGSAAGQLNLGRIYANAEGVPEDLAYAHMLFDLSATQGLRAGQEEKDLIEQRMTREQIAEAQRLRLTTPAPALQLLCWSGSLRGHAAEVMAACEQAVALTPDWADARDGRGLARALTGDVTGAIDDFEAFVALTRRDVVRAPWREVVRGPWRGVVRAQRQEWIVALRSGQNPFTAELLDRLSYRDLNQRRHIEPYPDIPRRRDR